MGRRAISIAVLSLLAAGQATPSLAATSIHVLGSFNGWDTSLWTSDPGMTRSGSVWRDTIAVFPWAVAQDYQDFKFVTDGEWDFYPDYVLCPARLDE